jgi:thioredoxin 1
MESITKDNFKEKLQNDKKVVVDFSSYTCAPCKLLAPVYEKVSEKFKEKAEFFTIEMIGNQEIFAEQGIRSVPVVIIFNQGKPIAESQGFTGEERLEKFLDDNL